MIRTFRAPNPSPMTGLGTNTYVLGRGEIVVVDAGPDVPAHVEALAAAGRIVAQLVTHGHGDHLPGAVALRARTGAPIVGHPDLPGVDRAAVDREEVELAGFRLRALWTPGHAHDHCCFWLPDRRTLFSGDLIAGAGTIVLSEVANALTLYLDSLEKVIALDDSTILPGHGPAISDGHAKAIEYREHRFARERQIAGALPATVDELVARIYADTPAQLLPAATRQVRVHLERLASLGRARADGPRWVAISG